MPLFKNKCFQHCSWLPAQIFVAFFSFLFFVYLCGWWTEIMRRLCHVPGFLTPQQQQFRPPIHPSVRSSIHRSSPAAPCWRRVPTAAARAGSRPLLQALCGFLAMLFSLLSSASLSLLREVFSFLSGFIPSLRPGANTKPQWRQVISQSHKPLVPIHKTILASSAILFPPISSW